MAIIIGYRPTIKKEQIMGEFVWIGGSKEAEAAELLRRMEADGLPLKSAAWTGDVRFTDVEGMDVPETRMYIEPEDADDWTTAWFKFKDAAEVVVWVRVDDDKYHALDDEEFGDE